jgi:hypothetical protein
MTIGHKHLTVLSEEQLEAVHSAIASIDAAEASLQVAAQHLAALPASFHAERSKIARSAEAMKWERKAVADRLEQLLGRDKSRSPHNTFGSGLGN